MSPETTDREAGSALTLSSITNVFTRNLNPVLEDVPAYVPGPTTAAVAEQVGIEPRYLVKLSSNEAPMGPSPSVREALRDIAGGDEIHRYPSPDMPDLREAIAASIDLDPSQILPVDGSSETWPVIVRAFSNPGEGVMTIEPSLRTYQQLAVVSERKPQVIQLEPPFELTADDVLSHLQEDTKVIFLSSPNNTTSRILTLNTIREIANGAPDSVVVVDEHYIEAAPNYRECTAVQLLGEVPNVIVTRTFSKMYGLAGIRIGYAAAPEVAINAMRKVRSLWAVSLPAKVAAIAAVTDEDHLKLNISTTAAGRRQFLEGFAGLPGVEAIEPPAGGFILFRVEGLGGDEVAEGVLRDGIMVRGDLTEGYARVSVGTRAQNSRFLSALQRLIESRR